MRRIQTRKSNRKTLIYSAVFAVLFLFLLWKCRYGYASNDEAFYLTIPFRMMRGDVLLLHEWHLSQLSAFLLYPVVKLYFMIFGNTEQIILNFRYLFIVVWAASALFLYVRLKVFSKQGAMLVSLAYLIYAPFGIMALSYNSLGILLLTSSCAIAVTAVHRLRLQYFITGVLFAGAVMCCPYLLLLYLLFTAVSAILYFKGKKKALFLWFHFSCGSAFLLVLFCVYLLSKGAFTAKLLAVFPKMFDDPEHGYIPFLFRVIGYYHFIFISSTSFKFCFFLTLILLLIPFVIRERSVCFAGTCLTCAFLILSYAYGTDPFTLEEAYITFYINFMMFPINLAVPYCMIHCRKKEIRIPFFGIWIPGFIYTFCLFFASNTQFYAIASASTVMTVAAIVILFMSAPSFFRDMKKIKHFNKTLLSSLIPGSLTLLMFVQLSSELWFRYSSIFWDPGISEQTEHVDYGPERGLIITPARMEEYQAMMHDVSVLLNHEGINNVLFLTDKTVMYLMAEKNLSTYSAWLSGVSDLTIQRLEEYYALFPEKAPDAVCTNRENLPFLEAPMQHDYQMEELATGSYLLVK